MLTRTTPWYVLRLRKDVSDRLSVLILKNSLDPQKMFYDMANEELQLFVDNLKSHFYFFTQIDDPYSSDYSKWFYVFIDDLILKFDIKTGKSLFESIGPEIETFKFAVDRKHVKNVVEKNSRYCADVKMSAELDKTLKSFFDSNTIVKLENSDL